MTDIRKLYARYCRAERTYATSEDTTALDAIQASCEPVPSILAASHKPSSNIIMRGFWRYHARRCIERATLNPVNRADNIRRARFYLQALRELHD